MAEVLLKENPFSLEVDGRGVSIPLEKIIAAERTCQTITFVSDWEHPSSLPPVLKQLREISLDFSHEEHSHGFEVRATVPLDHNYTFGREGFMVVREEGDLVVHNENLEFQGKIRKQIPVLELRFNYSSDSTPKSKLSRHPLLKYLSSLSPIKLEEGKMVIELDQLRLEIVQEKDRDYFRVNDVLIPAYLMEGGPLPKSRTGENLKVYFTPCPDPLFELNHFAQEFKEARVEVIESSGKVALAFTFATDYQLRKEGEQSVIGLREKSAKSIPLESIVFTIVPAPVPDQEVDQSEALFEGRLRMIGVTPDRYRRLLNDFSGQGYHLSIKKVTPIPLDEGENTFHEEGPNRNQPALYLDLKNDAPFDTDKIKEELALKLPRFTFSKPGFFIGEKYCLDMTEKVSTGEPYIARIVFKGTKSKELSTRSLL